MKFMETPICDFLNKYNSNNPLRFHMPGHKGKLDYKHSGYDITEIKGADDLFNPFGIISESEKVASRIFSMPTFYSTFGTSASIKAMLYLITLITHKDGEMPIILSGRNAHKSFLHASVLLDFNIHWISDNYSNLYTSRITPKLLKKEILKMEEKPIALYITSPDYLGFHSDIYSLSLVCKKYNIFLIVDNAHGSYEKFLEKSLNPIDNGADMCASSAHKTLPTLTGGSYLQISKEFIEKYNITRKDISYALSLFSSTSPSYLILESIDKTNVYLGNIKEELNEKIKIIDYVKDELKKNGYNVIGDEKLKITINTLSYGYKGSEIDELLIKKNIYSEFSDYSYIVFMISIMNSNDELHRLLNELLLIKKREEINTSLPKINKNIIKYTPKEVSMMKCEMVEVNKCLNRIMGREVVSCPPAIPVIVPGEVISKEAIEVMKFYGVEKCSVVREEE